MPRAE
jgi:Enoyl-(Acyl carrier protein) reductase